MTLSAATRKLAEAVLTMLQGEVGAALRGVLLAGSRVRGAVDANSDLDVLAIWDRPLWQKRTFRVDGITIDLVLAPSAYYDAMLARFDAPGSIAMFATGEAYYDPDGIVALLAIQARASYSRRLLPPPQFANFLFRHCVWSLLQDAKDALADDAAGFRYMLGICVELYADVHLRAHGEWRVDHKQRYRVLRDKYSATWRELDALLLAADGETALRALEGLFDAVLAPFGGVPATGSTEPIEWQRALRIF